MREGQRDPCRVTGFERCQYAAQAQVPAAARQVQVAVGVERAFHVATQRQIHTAVVQAHVLINGVRGAWQKSKSLSKFPSPGASSRTSGRESGRPSVN